MASDTDDAQPAYMAVPEEEVSFAIHPYTGPKHPGIDIDVFLEPLMQEMETLWKKGINIINGFTRQPINLRAIISITIHDY